MKNLIWLLLVSLGVAIPRASEGAELGTEGFADSGGVKIHYVTDGVGQLVVMIHGFPDYWYTWRAQMPELAKKYQVVAIDQRGYNKSDKPDGVQNYSMQKLAEDVRNVVAHFEKPKAIIVGHDWGGAVAWTFAMTYPQMTDRLIILNTPHPNGLVRELANNPRQRENSAYARRFQQPDAASQLTAEALASWVKDQSAREKYKQALGRSSIEAMLNYYKANYPREPYQEPAYNLPKVKCSVLMIHGLKDQALLASGLNNTWDWVEKDLTIVTIPDADHFVQQDAPETVTKTILRWLED